MFKKEWGLESITQIVCVCVCVYVCGISTQ